MWNSPHFGRIYRRREMSFDCFYFHSFSKPPLWWIFIRICHFSLSKAGKYASYLFLFVALMENGDSNQTFSSLPYYYGSISLLFKGSDFHQDSETGYSCIHVPSFRISELLEQLLCELLEQVWLCFLLKGPVAINKSLKHAKILIRNSFTSIVHYVIMNKPQRWLNAKWCDAIATSSPDR